MVSSFYIKYAILNQSKFVGRMKSHRFLNGKTFLKADYFYNVALTYLEF